MDARLARIMPGRNARKSIRGRKAPRNIGGRKAGKDHARSQGPEEHPGTQGPLRGERAAEGWALGRAWTRWEEQRAACRGERLFARNGSSVPVFRRDFIAPTWPTGSSDSGLLRQFSLGDVQEDFCFSRYSVCSVSFNQQS